MHIEGFKKQVCQANIRSEEHGEKIKLKPGNVENMKDWRDFLKKKTDSKFKINKY